MLNLLAPFSNALTRWTDADIANLREKWRAGETRDQIASDLGRSSYSIQHMAKSLRLGFRKYVWPKRLDKLRKLAAEGLTDDQLARRFDVSVNSIISARHRYGIACNRRIAEHAKQRKYKPKPRKTKTYPGAFSSPRRTRASGERPSHPKPPALAPLNIPLVETGFRRCKFIHGDDDLTCGHPTVFASSWCEHHYRIVFQPMTDREKKRREREAA